MEQPQAKPVLTPVEAVQKDDLDRVFYRDIGKSQGLQALTKDNEVLQTFAQDVWTSLYRTDPRMAEEPSIQRTVIETLQGMREYQDLHAMTVTDDIASGLGAVELVPGASKQMEELAKKVQERREQQEKEQKQKKPGQPGAGGDQPEGSSDAEPQLTEQEQSRLRQSLRAGIEQAQEKADDWAEIRRAWGIEPGHLAQMDPAARMKLAKELLEQKSMRRIAELVGRLKNVCDSQFAQSPDRGSSEVHGVTLGRDLGRLLPSELIKLRRSRAEFYRDFLEGKLLCYNLKGQEEMGKGPILVAIDESGSMSGNPIEWAKAVAVALMHLADKENRAFGYMTFDTAVQNEKLFPVAGSISVQDKLDLARYQLSGGGTAFDPPLAKAFEMCEQIQGFKQADLVFITDGICSVSDVKKIQELKKRFNLRIFGVLISSYGGYGAEKVLDEFCDRCAVVRQGTLELGAEIIQQALGKGRKDGGQ